MPAEPQARARVSQAARTGAVHFVCPFPKTTTERRHPQVPGQWAKGFKVRPMKCMFSKDKPDAGWISRGPAYVKWSLESQWEPRHQTPSGHLLYSSAPHNLWVSSEAALTLPGTWGCSRSKGAAPPHKRDTWFSQCVWCPSGKVAEY